MNALYFLLSILTATTQVLGEKLFIPSASNARQGYLGIPGFLVNKEEVLTVPKEVYVSVVDAEKPGVADVESRAKLGAGALRDDASSIVAFQADTSIKAAAPLCLACTCRLGRTSCKDAGGIAYFSSGSELTVGGVIQVICTSTTPCVTEAPETMSACDANCKKRTTTCDPQFATPSSLQCTENVDKSICGTDCQYRSFGEKVVCDQQAIAKGVMNDIPKDVCNIFGGRRRRSTGAELRNTNFLGNFILGRFIPTPASTIRVPGAALLAYASSGRCLPQEIANAPLCTKLD